MASAGVSTGALAGADGRVRHSPHVRPGQRDAMLILTSQFSREAGEGGTRRGLEANGSTSRYVSAAWRNDAPRATLLSLGRGPSTGTNRST